VTFFFSLCSEKGIHCVAKIWGLLKVIIVDAVCNFGTSNILFKYRCFLRNEIEKFA